MESPKAFNLKAFAIKVNSEIIKQLGCLLAIMTITYESFTITLLSILFSLKVLRIA